MTETAQGASPAESEVLSTADALAGAAEAFKVSLGQAETEAPEEEKEWASTGSARTDVGDAVDEAEGPAAEEEAQPEEEGEEEVPLPASWPADKAGLWRALPPEARAFVAARDGQRDAAVNAKFMEAARLRKAHEAELSATRDDRTRALQASDLAIAMIQPQEPPLSMLAAGSPDYDPDGYHLAKARYEQTLGLIDDLAARQQQLLSQAREEEDRDHAQRFHAINDAAQPALLRDVPELADQAKAPAMLRDLMDYAVANGAPPEIFETPTTALEWHTLWKAREYDRLQSAKARVASDPPPPRKAGPVVRPGIATTASARAAARRQQDFERLAQSGSIEDGAAVFKHYLKG